MCTHTYKHIYKHTYHKYIIDILYVTHLRPSPHVNESRIMIDVPAAAARVALDVDAVGRGEDVHILHWVLVDEGRWMCHPGRVCSGGNR